MKAVRFDEYGAATYPLAAVRQAYEQLEGSHVHGKIVLVL